VIAFQGYGLAQNTGGEFSIGSGTTLSGTSITLPIVYLSPAFLSTGTVAPASAQFTLAYSGSDIAAASIVADPSLATLGKSISCASPASGTVNCVVYGMSATQLATGVIAEATFNVNSAAPATALNIPSALGTDSGANAMAMSGMSGSITITPPVSMQSLSCVPATLGSGQSSSCTATIAGQHTTTQVSIASNSPLLTVPSQISIASGSMSATFSATAGQVTSSIPAQISASLNGTATAANVQLLPPGQLISLNCGTTVAPGATVLCTALINGLQQSAASMTLSSSTTSVKIPSAITVRPGQSTIWFNAIIDPAAPTQAATLTAVLGSNTAVAKLGVQALLPVVTAPAARFFPIGQATSFNVQATDPLRLQVKLTVTRMPAGAQFSPGSGRFLWAPTASQEGINPITFVATDSHGNSASATTNIEVGNGKPFITALINAASDGSTLICSPGSVAQAQGVNFGSTSTVLVNGISQPINTPGENTVNFVCPNIAPGTALSIVVQNSLGASAPAMATLQTVAPGIFNYSSNGTGPAQIYLSGTNIGIAIPDYTTAAEQALPGDTVDIYVTGINPAIASTTVTISGIAANVTAITPVTGQQGTYAITCTIPAAVSAGPAVPVIATSTGSDGSIVTSNTASIAVAAPVF
jgi:uncharacterized protein (TIGR03437 family)